MSLEIRLLGPVEITVGGVPLSVDTRKAVALLAYLAVAGRPQDREHLADLLWPSYDEERGRATLRRTLSALKSGVGDGWIQVDRNRVGLVSGEVHLDVRALDDLERLHPHPAGESCPACLQTLKKVVDLHRGDFMQGFTLRDARGFEEWQLAQSESVRRELRRALDLLVDSYVALGHDDEALVNAEKRIVLDPLNEPACRALMRLHARKDDRGAVVATYRSLVATLERELGVEPLEETTDLYRALSRGHGAENSTARPQLAPIDTGHLPFIGRTREWDRIVTAYQKLGEILAVEGEPGIGKTRLVEEFVGHAGALGARTISVRSHEGESNVAYGVLTEALRGSITSRVLGRLSQATVEELARLLPELEVEPAKSPVASRFYEAVRSAFEEGLRGERPGVLVFEDLHWSDEATLDVLAYVARRAAETGICLFVTWRTEEVGDESGLTRLVRGLPWTRLRLDRFTTEDLRRLITEVAIVPDDEADGVARRLIEETEGVPYFVTEYLKAIKSGSGWEIPSTVRELMVRRLANARGAAAQILDAAAVIDRAVDLETLSRVGGRTDLETADALDQLARSGLMRILADTDPARYEFSHEKLRAVAYEQMGRARKHVLHRRTAEVLIESSTPADRNGPLASSIARHFELGGGTERAVHFHSVAGMWAQSVFAHAQALDHFRHALGLGDPSPVLHEAIADVLVVQGNYAEAVASYETAAALADQPEAIDRKLGALHLRRGDYELAEMHLHDALNRSTDDAVTADILVDLSLAAHRRGADELALEHANAAVERAARVGDPGVRARAENSAGMLASARGDAERARSHLEAALGHATSADDLPAMTAALNNLALVEREEGALDRATELTMRALDSCRRFGDRHREAALENNLADLFNANGDRDRAMEHLKRATAIFAEVGAEPEGPLPEVWKLVDW